VLTDIIMPDMDGIETVQTFHALLKATPIIAMSALRDTPYLRAAAAFGARETLAKPFTVEQLRNALARALSNA
jgi:CheY-like chemotaxis protein